MRGKAFAPGSIGNVGPGFDVLGLAFDGAGDSVYVELHKDAPAVREITGRDADLVPLDPERNVCSIAAEAILRGSGYHAVVTIEKGLPLAGGMGGSAASSVAGAYAALVALGDDRDTTRKVLAAALEAESVVSGRHLDNIAPSTVGGLALSRSVDPIDVIKLPVGASWWIALVTPRVRIQTKEARALLPMESPRSLWIQEMANTTAMAHAFAAGDGELLRRSLEDVYAEPLRAPLIPRFREVKQAALDAGSYGCSISGSGPTVFAIAESEAAAMRCADAMRTAFAEIESTSHVGPIATEGVRAVPC